MYTIINFEIAPTQCCPGIQYTYLPHLKTQTPSNSPPINRSDSEYPPSTHYNPQKQPSSPYPKALPSPADPTLPQRSPHQDPQSRPYCVRGERFLHRSFELRSSMLRQGRARRRRGFVIDFDSGTGDDGRWTCLGTRSLLGKCWMFGGGARWWVVVLERGFVVI